MYVCVHSFVAIKYLYACCFPFVSLHSAESFASCSELSTFFSIYIYLLLGVFVYFFFFFFNMPIICMHFTRFIVIYATHSDDTNDTFQRALIVMNVLGFCYFVSLPSFLYILPLFLLSLPACCNFNLGLLCYAMRTQRPLEMTWFGEA